MQMKPITILTALAGLVTTTTVCGTIIKPLSATSSIPGDAGSSVDYLLNDNAGFAADALVDEFLAAVTIDTGDTIAKAAAAFAELSNGGQGESWTRPTGSGNPVFVFDLGADTAIGSIVLWQYGNNGGGYDRIGNHTRDFELIFHTEAEGATFDFSSAGGAEAIEFSGTMEPALDPNPDNGVNTTLDNPAQLFFFGAQETARYVALRIASNYLPPAHPSINFGGDRYGLGEVRFATEAVHDPQISGPESIVIQSDGSAETLQVELTNAGGAESLTVTGASITGLDAAAFTITTDFTSPLTIGPAGLMATMDIDFDPSSLTPGTPIEAILEISSNDPVYPTLKVPLGGVVRNPWIDTVASIDLGIIPPGAGTQNFTIDVRNLGASIDLVADYADFTTFGGPFAAVDDLTTSNLTVAPGATGVINLRFDAGSLAGVFSDTLEIDSNDPTEATRIIPVTINVERDPEISAPIDVILETFPFGAGPQAFTVEVANIGAANDLMISSVDVFGPDGTNFTIDSFDSTIPAGGTGVIGLTFDPTGFTGDFFATLEIISNDIGVPFSTDVILVATVDPHTAPASSPSGLVAWWSLDSELDAGKDDSGNGFDGVPSGTPTPTPGANANTGGALSFNGSTTIEVPWSSYLNPESFTVTLWACPTITGGAHRSAITSRDDSPGATQGYILYHDPTSNWAFWTGDGNPGWHSTPGGGVSTSVWTHLAISYDAVTQTKSFFVNGVLFSSSTAPPALYAPNGPQKEGLHIAGGGDTGTQFRFTGKLDDVALFNTALSADDINAIKGNGVAGFLSPATKALNLGAIGYTGGSLGLSVGNIPAGETFHLRGSTDGENFAPLIPPIDFDSTTPQPIMVPSTESLLLLRAYEGPSNPPG